jgi:CheY-like chemotaxis protein
MRNARVLVLDDDENWIHDFRTIFQGRVARLEAAQTLEAALELLDRYYFNVAVVDLRLDDADPTNDQGMAFMQAIEDRHLHGVVLPIFCTAYSDVNHVNKAWRDHNIIDYINKNEFDEDALIAAVEKALNRLRCPEPIALETAARTPLRGLWQYMDWAQREVSLELEAELHDLLCRLFPDATRLWLQPIPAGQGGAGMMEVEPSYRNGTGMTDIVKFGKRDKIRREMDNYDHYVDPYIGNQIATKVEGATGRVMGAIRYRRVGSGDLRAATLGEHFALYGPEATCRVIDALFAVTCRRWYDNREGPRRQRDLVELYVGGQHIIWDEVWAAAAETVAAAHITESDGKLAFPGVSGHFLHPQTWLDAHEHTYSLPTWVAMTHGDLNERNVLVTQDHNCWLIDFYRTGNGHILRDVVELETAFKFSLTDLETFTERAEFEAALLEAPNLSGPIRVQDPHAPYAATADVIAHLRSLGADIIGLLPDLREYQVALLLQTLKYLSLGFLKGNLRARSHALLSAAMICSKLGLPRGGYSRVPRTSALSSSDTP